MILITPVLLSKIKKKHTENDDNRERLETTTTKEQNSGNDKSLLGLINEYVTEAQRKWCQKQSTMDYLSHTPAPHHHHALLTKDVTPGVLRPLRTHDGVD